MPAGGKVVSMAFTYARRLKHVKPGRVNWFRFKDHKLKAYVSEDARTIVLEVPKEIKYDVTSEGKLVPYKGRLRKVTRRQKTSESRVGASLNLFTYVRGIQNKSSKHILDMNIVADEMSYVDRISEFFSPLSYSPVPTFLVDEDDMDRLCPQKIVEAEAELKAIISKVGELVKKEYEELYEKARKKGIQTEKIFVGSDWLENIETLKALEEFCRKISDFFPEEANELLNKIRTAHEYQDLLERSIHVLVAMGCFVAHPKPRVYICPERIRKCEDSLNRILEFKQWIESLKNPSAQQKLKVNAALEDIYRFVVIHEHAHAATVPRDKINQDPETSRMMNEGIAQWITCKILQSSPNTSDTLKIFEKHADAVPREYRFYRQLNRIEKRYGTQAVISAILCWGHSTDLYDWKEFIRKAENGNFELRQIQKRSLK